MMTTIIVVCTIVVLLVFLWYLTRATSDDPIDAWEIRGRKVNLDAFRLLLDHEEEIYLWKSVRKAEFRKLQRKRVALALRVVQMMASNAALLMRLATLARQSEDHEIVSAADRLMYLAFQVRMNALVTEPCLFLKWICPLWTMSVPTPLERYERLVENCDWILARRQQGPAHSRMAG